jgi:hypothetical protein
MCTWKKERKKTVLMHTCAVTRCRVCIGWTCPKTTYCTCSDFVMHNDRIWQCGNWRLFWISVYLDKHSTIISLLYVRSIIICGNLYEYSEKISARERAQPHTLALATAGTGMHNAQPGHGQLRHRVQARWNQLPPNRPTTNRKGLMKKAASGDQVQCLTSEGSAGRSGERNRKRKIPCDRNRAAC